MAIKVTIIGLGIMGRRMLEHMNLHAAFQPSAFWDPDPAACSAAKQMSPDTRLASSADDALGDADLVYLACPPRPRKQIALTAAGAGKAVFLEKPLGIDGAESTALVTALERAGVPAAINFTQAAGAALGDISRDALDGTLGNLVGAEIIVTYSAWPRGWQMAADWLRLRDEGGMTREVISHFLFFIERILGPLSVVSAHPTYPADFTLCETHLVAQLENADGLPVSIMAAVGGAQPDRQELTIKASKISRRVAEFSIDMASDGGPFTPLQQQPDDPRAVALQAQLDQLKLCFEGEPHCLATPAEGLRVQKLVETMLSSSAPVKKKETSND